MSSQVDRYIYLFTLILGVNFFHLNSALVETERIEEFHRRNHTWPAVYNPPSEGWKNINDRRFAQISQIEDSGHRYEG